MLTTMPNGLYKMAFETSTGMDYGVAYLHDGKLRGGDSGMAYLVTYKQEGKLFSAEMSVTQHRTCQARCPRWASTTW